MAWTAVSGRREAFRLLQAASRMVMVVNKRVMMKALISELGFLVEAESADFL